MLFTRDAELFRGIFNSMFQFIGLMQPDGTLLEANQTALDFGGITAEDVVGRPFWECHWWTISPATQAQLRVAITQAARGEFVRYEVDVLGAQGRVITIDFSIKPIVDSSGQVTLLIPEGRDITDRKQAERERDQIFELSSDLLASVSIDGYFKRLNPAWEQTLGYSHTELLAMPFLDLIHPDDRETARREVDRLASGTPTVFFENRYRHRDGSYRWLAWNASTLPNESVFYCTARDTTMQKQAAQVLRESEELLSSVLNSSLDGIAAFKSLRDADGQIIDFIWILVNPRAEEMLKRSGEDLLGKRLLETMPAHRESGLFDAYKQVVETGQSRSQEFCYDGDNLQSWFQHVAVKLDDGFAVTFRDITRQKAAEEFRLALSTAQMGTWDLNLATGEVTRSNGTDQIFGYPPDGSIRTIEDYMCRVFPDDVAPVQAAISLSIEKWTEHSVEYRVVRPDKTIRWVSSRGNMLLDEQGQPVRLVGALTDITERKQAEEQVRESEERFRVALKNAPIQVYSTDQQLRYTWVYNLTNNFTPVHVIGKRDDELLPPAHVAELVAFKQHVLDTGVAQRREICIRMDDVERTYDVTAEPLRDETDAIMGLTVAAMDITRLKQVESAMREAKEAAETANRMKSVFLANMSHEIRTPLTSMIGYGSLLAKRLKGKERTQAQRIEDGGKRLLETLNALLMLAKLEAGGVEVQFDDLHVAAEVGEIIRLYRQQAEAKGLMLTLEIKPPAAIARAHLDRGALNSILQNLISNAIKFTHVGGITVTVDLGENASHNAADEAIPAPAGWVRVHVEDTGVGIAPAFLPHIFDAFRQESTGLSRSYDGAGLGLAITKQLAEKMYGSISVISKKDQGSRFTISFPQAVTDNLIRARQVVAATPVAAPVRCHILLVEDNKDTQELIKALLEDRCIVTTAASFQEARDVVYDLMETIGQVFDAVLVDINLGGGFSGIDLLAALRTLPIYHEVAIAALTAYALPGDRERFLEMGFDAYLRKPFTADELLEFIAQLLPW